MKKKYKITLIAISIIIALCIGLIAYKLVFNGKKEKVTSNVVENIKGYPYTLDDRDTTLMKDEFKNLKTILESDDIVYEEYAKSLAKLYVIDFYTLSNKFNKYDVGSVEYVYTEYQENFKLNAHNTFYKYIKDNSYNKRTQELPEVKSVNIDEITKISYNTGSQELDSYKISINWEYVTDYGDEKAITMIVSKIDNTLYVMESGSLES